MRRSERIAALVRDIDPKGGIVLVRNVADGEAVNDAIDGLRPELAGNTVAYAIPSAEAAKAVLATAKGKSVYIDVAFVERGNPDAVRAVSEILHLKARAA